MNAARGLLWRRAAAGRRRHHRDAARRTDRRIRRPPGVGNARSSIAPRRPLQGVVVTTGGDVWILGVEKRQLVHFPKGDLSKGRIVCEGDSAEPCKSFLGPFHLGIDPQDRIWVANSGINHVTRFPAADPSKAENFKSGFNSSGLGIDSQGNVWVTNRFGSGLLGMAHLIDMGVHLKLEGVTGASDYLTTVMSRQKGGAGSVNLLRPDGSQYPGSPFTGGGLPRGASAALRWRRTGVAGFSTWASRPSTGSQRTAVSS
jgi:hypothetical protein